MYLLYLLYLRLWRNNLLVCNVCPKVYLIWFCLINLQAPITSVIPSMMSAVSRQPTNARHHLVGVQYEQHESRSVTHVQTPLFPQNSHCGSNLWTRTQSLTSRMCGACRVNERFQVGRAALTAGGDLCVTPRGFPFFYDADNIVPALSCWYTVPPGYHYCPGNYIFSCLDHVFFNSLLSVVALKYFHIPKCVVTTHQFASLKRYF